VKETRDKFAAVESIEEAAAALVLKSPILSMVPEEAFSVWRDAIR
jgi:hypothetical protein